MDGIILVLQNAIKAKFLEVLLTIILSFNVGAYSFLWYKIRRVEEDVGENESRIFKVYKRIFGISEDETDEGHLVETQHEFNEVYNRLDSIEDKIDIIENNNRQSHREVRAMIQQMFSMLSDEEKINIDEEDMDKLNR